MCLTVEAVSVRQCLPRPCSTRSRFSLGVVKPFVRQLRCCWHNEKPLKLPSHSRGGQMKNASSVDAEVSLDEEDIEGSVFDWFKHWWPVQVVENLPTDRPCRIQLLGKYYVVWKGHSGNWIAMDDECPHRLAPLSEGRIEKDGNLLCSYHAWRFTESGKCVKIPHAEDEKAHSVACNSPRSAVQTYPCKTRGSLLYIWPDKSTNAFSESEKVLPPIDDDIADFLQRSAAEGALHMYIRYLPYSFDVLMENLCDPSHLSVSHHDLGPDLSRYDAGPLEARLEEGTTSGRAIVTLEYKSTLPFINHAFCELRKPGVVLFASKKKKDEDVPFIRTYLSATPICSGTTAIFSVTVNPSHIAQTERSDPLQRLFNQIMVLVLHTTFYNPLFDGDSVFLHQQDKKIRKHGSTFSAQNEYYSPTPADLLVMDFRIWFESKGQNGAAYGGTGARSTRTELAREKLLDRYEQHTKHCKICREFLERLEFFSKTLKVLSLGALFIGSLLLIRASNAPGVEWKIVLKDVSIWIAIAVGTLSSLLRDFLEKNIKPRFYFEDWVHADRD